MKKILLISYSDSDETLLSIKETLDTFGYTISCYPLFKKSIERTCCVSTDETEKYIEEFLNFIKEFSPDILFWTFIDVPCSVLKYIRANWEGLFVLYCKNDPLIWEDETSDIKSKCPFFDLVVSSCLETRHLFLENGSSDVLDLFPPINSKLNFPLDVPEYTCDVSFCCGELYDDPMYKNQVVTRREVIEKLSEMSSPSSTSHNEPSSTSHVEPSPVKFNLYGPYYLFHMFPKNYRGFVPYKDLNKIFNSSRINLSTHSTNREGYLSRRDILVIGSGGLLLTDKVKGIEKMSGGCVAFEGINDLGNKIKDILVDYKKYEHVKQKGHSFSEMFTWSKWCLEIHKWICMYFFDEYYYRESYSLPDNVSCVKSYWKEFGIDFKHSPFKFSVPKDFDYTRYSIDKSLSGKRDYLYWHYRINSASDRYIIKMDCAKNLDIKKIMEDCKIDTNGWFKINSLFQNISSGENIDRNIVSIGVLSSQYPLLNIPKLLQLYFQLIET